MTVYFCINQFKFTGKSPQKQAIMRYKQNFIVKNEKKKKIVANPKK